MNAWEILFQNATMYSINCHCPLDELIVHILVSTNEFKGTNTNDLTRSKKTQHYTGKKMDPGKGKESIPIALHMHDNIEDTFLRGHQTPLAKSRAMPIFSPSPAYLPVHYKQKKEQISLVLLARKIMKSDTESQLRTTK